ncbi:MAG: PIG-L deacetylase family protein [Phycisphaerae bacterium]
MSEPVRVLAFMAHPDDAEMYCAGTLARLKREAGCEIVIATATSGDCGSMTHRPDELARIRHREAVTAAGLLGAEYYCAGSQDILITYDAATIRAFTEVLRKARPHLVISHPPVDYMVDHEMTSRLVRTACFGASCPNLITGDVDPAPPTRNVPHLYYTDAVECKDLFGRPIDAQFIVDISATMDIKEKMLACHASQREWLRAQHKMDHYIETMKKAAAERGRCIGKAYGEGFRQHLGHGYPQDNLLGKLLGLADA